MPTGGTSPADGTSTEAASAKPSVVITAMEAGRAQSALEDVCQLLGYNQRNELVQATHDGQVMNYGYDLLGQRILDDRTMPNGNQLASFRYNQRLELTRSERRRGCNPPEVHSYAYDLNHNITKKDGVSYTNNLADQLLSVAGGGTLTYNDSGAATNVQGWDVSYNCADQITGIQAPGKNIAYQYDAGGQRVSKTVNGVTQNFLWNGGDIAKEYTSTGAVRADYFLGAGREGIKTNGQWYYYLSDIQGSTLMLTNASGQSVATYDYSDYGETRQTSGSTALYNPFLYTGQEYDFETSLYHLRARHYSPSLGRFFSRDPIGYAGGSNMMGYCAGDPVNHTDPTGLLTDFILRVFPALTAEGNVHIRVKVTTIVITDALKWAEANLAVFAVKFNSERTAIVKTRSLTSQSWSWKNGDFAPQYLISDAFELPVLNPIIKASDICGWDAIVFKTTGYFFNILNMRSFTAPDQFYMMLKPSEN